jgi:hypothetical protein
MRLKRLQRALVTVAMCAGLGLAGCALPSRSPALSLSQSTQTYVLGIPNARFLLPDTSGLAKEFVDGAQRQIETRRQAGLTGPLPPLTAVAISGGGDEGAYGAGVIVGWTAHGDRPTFDAVTGISTGALSAPFVFLGPDYDPQLKAVYTQTTAKSIYRPRNVTAAIFSDAMGDTTPLREVVATYMDDTVIRRIAEEYRKGRLLLILSTNLDAARPCVWNVGAIAASGQPNARELIIKIMLASSAIPAAFPPVMFDLEVNGQHLQEMHVDGGVIAQAFLYPPNIDVTDVARQAGTTGRKRDGYLIRNGRLLPEGKQVKRQTLDIASRAVNTMISVAGVNDMYRIFGTTSRDGVGFHLAYIDDDFKEPYVGPFDTTYMNKLFQYGYDQGSKSGGVWKDRPPFWTQ